MYPIFSDSPYTMRLLLFIVSALIMRRLISVLILVLNSGVEAASKSLCETKMGEVSSIINNLADTESGIPFLAKLLVKSGYTAISKRRGTIISKSVNDFCTIEFNFFKHLLLNHETFYSDSYDVLRRLTCGFFKVHSISYFLEKIGLATESDRLLGACHDSCKSTLSALGSPFTDSPFQYAWYYITQRGSQVTGESIVSGITTAVRSLLTSFKQILEKLRKNEIRLTVDLPDWDIPAEAEYYIDLIDRCPIFPKT